MFSSVLWFNQSFMRSFFRDRSLQFLVETFFYLYSEVYETDILLYLFRYLVSSLPILLTTFTVLEIIMQCALKWGISQINYFRSIVQPIVCYDRAYLNLSSLVTFVAPDTSLVNVSELIKRHAYQLVHTTSQIYSIYPYVHLSACCRSVSEFSWMTQLNNALYVPNIPALLTWIIIICL